MPTVRLASALLMGFVLLYGGAGLAAQTAAPHRHDPVQPQEQAAQKGMEACREMMARHQKMMEEMKAMDARLEELVAKMNAAQGQAKIDATAAVVNEMVEQRKTMRERMMTMQHGMTGHMMGHVAQGRESMAACPMMKMMQD